MVSWSAACQFPLCSESDAQAVKGLAVLVPADALIVGSKNTEVAVWAEGSVD